MNIVQSYFVSKTTAEQEAWKYAKENKLDFVSIIPPLVVGSFITQSMPPSLITGLSPITGTFLVLSFPHIYSITGLSNVAHIAARGDK